MTLSHIDETSQPLLVQHDARAAAAVPFEVRRAASALRLALAGSGSKKTITASLATAAGQPARRTQRPDSSGTRMSSARSCRREREAKRGYRGSKRTFDVTLAFFGANTRDVDIERSIFDPYFRAWIGGVRRRRPHRLVVWIVLWMYDRRAR